MTFAWGVLIPMGMILALFYKVVWPRGHWFYVRFNGTQTFPCCIHNNTDLYIIACCFIDSCSGDGHCCADCDRWHYYHPGAC